MGLEIVPESQRHLQGFIKSPLPHYVFIFIVLIGECGVFQLFSLWSFSVVETVLNFIQKVSLVFTTCSVGLYWLNMF